MNKWNTRKLVGFGVLFAGSLLLCYTGKVTGIETYWFWMWLFGIYIVGNIGAKVTSLPIIGKLKTGLKLKSRSKK